MHRCAIVILTLVGLVAVSRAARSADDKAAPPAVVVQARSLDSLLGDVRYLAELAGRPEAADEAMTALLKGKDAKKGIPGVDGSRPLGLFGFVSDNLLESSVVIMIPISDETALLKSLDDFGVKAARGKDGIYSLTMPTLPVSLYLRFAHKYAYVAAPEKTGLTDEKLLSPDQVFNEKTAATLSGKLQISQVPDLVKQIILGQLELRLAAIADEKPAGESEARAALRTQAVKDVSKHLAGLINDGGALGLRFDVDHSSKKLVGEISVTGQPKSAFQASIAELAQNTSHVAGLVNGKGALSGRINLPLTPELRQTVGKALSDEIQKALAHEQDPARKQFGAKVYDLLEPTLKAANLDAAMELRGPTPSNHFGLIAAMRVNDGLAIEKGLKDLVKDLSESDRGKIKLDAETTAGVRIHRVDIQNDKRFDEQARKTFGDHPLYLAIRADAAFVALGEGGLDGLRQALAAPPRAGANLELEMAMGRLASGPMARDGELAAKAARAAFGPRGENDSVRISFSGGQALTLRFELSTPVIKFLGALPAGLPGQ